MGQADFVVGDISMDGFQVVRGLHFSRMLMRPAFSFLSLHIHKAR